MNGAASSVLTNMYATTTRNPGSRRTYASPSRISAAIDWLFRTSAGGSRSWVTAKITARKLAALNANAHA